MARILAVDDDGAILALIKNALQKDGHEVTCVRQFTETLYSTLPYYELILLDVMMPETDGFAICKEIRNRVDCPILFLTARTQDEDVELGLALGGDDYMKKPFSIVELRARVKAHLRREHREKLQSLCISDVYFLLARKEAVFREQQLPFTRSEYEICLLLARYHGQVFSKEQIYEAVFGYDGQGSDSAITEHIKNIRRKFAAVGIAPIETVWGIGYRWNEK